MAHLKVIRVEKKLYGARITVKAKKGTVSAVFDSLFGERDFYLNHGRTLTLRVKGRHWRVGDKFSMSYLVPRAYDWSNIPWQWDYS